MAGTDATVEDQDNVGYPKMVPATSFSGADLPGHFENDTDLCELIKNTANLTGKIQFQTQSPKQWGTGFIQRIRFDHGKCPCSNECEGCGSKFAILTVTTVVHIFDKNPSRKNKSFTIVQNPESAQMFLSYKSDDHKKYKSLQLDGHRLLETDKDLDIDSDWCCLEFVTHELRQVEELNTILTSYQELQRKVYQNYKGQSVNLVVVVGYPGDRPKQISLGKTIRKYEILKEIRDGQKWGRYYYDAPTQKGSSGSPVLVLGQPISGFGYWFGHPHNHHGKCLETNDNKSSIGVQYVDM